MVLTLEIDVSVPRLLAGIVDLLRTRRNFRKKIIAELFTGGWQIMWDPSADFEKSWNMYQERELTSVLAKNPRNKKNY